MTALEMGHFDESLSERKDNVLPRIFVMGGYVSSVEKWEVFETAWAPLLDEHHIREFHMSDMENMQGEFEGWDNPKKIAFMTAAVPLVTAAVTIGVMAGFDLHELRSLMSGPVEDADVIRHAYGLGVYATLFRLVNVLPDGVTNVAMLFDRASRSHQSIGRDVYDQMQIQPDTHGKLGVKDWVCSEKFPPLQAADFIAYETMKEFYQQIAAGEGLGRHHDVRKSLREVVKYQLYWDDFYSGSRLEALRRQYANLLAGITH